jgi:hypothetical protein
MADKMAVSALLLLCTATLSSVNSCLLLSTVDCFPAVCIEAVPRPLHVFHASQSYLYFIKKCHDFVLLRLYYICVTAISYFLKPNTRVAFKVSFDSS